MNDKFNYPLVSTLDDLLNASYKYILENGEKIYGKRGSIREVLNFAITLSNPRSRVSRSLDRRLVKSKFAEFAWFLSEDSNKNYIKPYISIYNKEESENNKILGAYGPKIFGRIHGKVSQYERICEQILARKETKQAFLVLSNDTDFKVNMDEYSSPPCTIGLHFLVRKNKLNLTAYMRSNDAYFGLPHDLFCFTMLQEMISIRTNIPLGTYTHICSSLHLYEDKINRAKSYLEEGFYEGISMPKMTEYNDKILNTVVNSYNDKIQGISIDNLTPYWSDYILFSNRFEKSHPEKEWLDKFKFEEFKAIAICSKTK